MSSNFCVRQASRSIAAAPQFRICVFRKGLTMINKHLFIIGYLILIMIDLRFSTILLTRILIQSEICK